MWGGSRARVFICSEPCDMRKSFSGLCGMVRTILEADPLSGHYFFFLNKKQNYVKILTWDGEGFCLFCKMLPKGTFRTPKRKELLIGELMALLETPVSAGRKGSRYRHIAA